MLLGGARAAVEGREEVGNSIEAHRIELDSERNLKSGCRAADLQGSHAEPPFILQRVRSLRNRDPLNIAELGLARLPFLSTHFEERFFRWMRGSSGPRRPFRRGCPVPRSTS